MREGGQRPHRGAATCAGRSFPAVNSRRGPGREEAREQASWHRIQIQDKASMVNRVSRPGSRQTWAFPPSLPAWLALGTTRGLSVIQEPIPGAGERQKKIKIKITKSLSALKIGMPSCGILQSEGGTRR